MSPQPLTNSALQARPVTDIERFITTVARGFEDTPLMTSFITEKDQTPPPYPHSSVNLSRRREHFYDGLKHVFDTTNAEFVEAGDYSAIAMWEPSNFDGQLFALLRPNPGPILKEWQTKVRAAKLKYLGSTTGEVGEDGKEKFKPFYHLSFLVRNPEVEKVLGAISAVVRPWLERARKERVPAWLEATSMHAVRIYEFYGFRVAERIVIGEGKVDAGGWPREGGEGASAWCMIVDP